MAEEEYDSGKTVEELAREAMDAIKHSQDVQRMQEEQEAKAKEESLKREVENRVRSKMKRLQREIEKEEKNKVPEVDTRFMATWSNPDGAGLHYIGEYNDEYAFKISRGINLFHLYIKGKNIIHESWQQKAHTSISLDSLKEKADSILKKSNKKLAEIKKAKKQNPPN